MQNKIEIEIISFNYAFDTFWVQRWTLSFSNVLNSEKTANRSSETYVKRRLYCFHHHSFIIHHQWLIFPFLRFQSWAMDPPFWIGLMDDLHGPGPWTPCNGQGPCAPSKKIKKEKWTLSKMQINIIQQYYSFSDNLRDKFWVGQSFWPVTWTQNMDPHFGPGPWTLFL